MRAAEPEIRSIVRYGAGKVSPENLPDARLQVSAIVGEVAERFGTLPNFLCTASAAPGLIDELWAFAKSAYLDCPLPSLFKERLFVHLSRFCGVRYCIVRHAGFLMGKGRPAGDATATPHTLEQIVRLLSRPAPDAVALHERLLRLSRLGELGEAPLPETQEEGDLFDALTVMFLSPQVSEAARRAVRTSMGDHRFELLTAFLAFVRTAHYWTETHPELTFEPDMLASMEQHPELTALLLDTSEAAEASFTVQLHKALGTLEVAQRALGENERRQSFLLKLGDALRPLPGATEIRQAALDHVAEHFSVDSVVYYEFDADGDHVVNREERTIGPSVTPPIGRLRDFGSAFYEALGAGRTIEYEDAETDPRLEESSRAAYRAAKARSGVGAPLMRRGRLAAALCITHGEPRHWSDDDLRLLEEAAERTREAVERACAEAALRESEGRLAAELSRTQLLQRLSTRLIPEQSPEALHEQILDAAVELMEADAVSIQMLEQDGQRLRRLATRNLHPESTEYWTWVDAGHASTCGQALRANSRVVVEDVETNGELAATGDLEAFRRSGTRAVQSTPLVSRSGRPIGMISTHWHAPRRLEERDFDLFDILARQVADLLERSQTEAALRASEERQAFLLRLADALRPLVNPIEVQAAAARVLGEHLGVDRALYCEAEPDEDHLVVHRDYTSAGTASFAGRWRLNDFGPLWEEEYRAGRRLATADTREVDGANAAVFEATGFQACLGVPIDKDGRLVGLLVVHSAAPREWTPPDVALVEETAERTWAAVDRARAEAALRQSEERLRQFGEASQDVLWIRDADTLQWRYLTPAFETIYGLSRDEALAGDNYRNWQDLIVSEDRERAVAAIARVSSGEHVTFEYRVRRPSDGTIRWLRNTDFPITDEAGKITLVGGVGHDVTRMKTIETEAAASEERVRLLMEGIPQLVWRSCDQGRWTWSSPQWREFTGQSLEGSRGMGWLDVVHPDDHPATLQAWEDAKLHGLLDVEYRVYRAADGAWIWHHTRSVPVRDGAGRIVEWLGTSTDIHELREMQERQKVLVAELQHRTRNLMGVVRTMADKTARASGDLPDFRERFRDRLDALARVQSLLSRMNDHDRVTFDELIDTELKAMDGNAGRVTLKGPVGVRLRSSTVQTLAMALHELSTNALKYGALGQSSGRLVITWRVERPGDDRPWLHIDWHETGCECRRWTPPPGEAARAGS